MRNESHFSEETSALSVPLAIGFSTGDRIGEVREEVPEKRPGSPTSRQVKRHEHSCEKFSYSLSQPSRNV
jgi:hypothetical protein